MKIISVVYGILGAGLVCYGLWSLFPPAAWLFAGAFCLVDAWRLSRSVVAKKVTDA